jgi:hypothetical protein
MHYALVFRLSQLLLHPLALNRLIVRISLISTDYLCIFYVIMHNYTIAVRFGLDCWADLGRFGFRKSDGAVVGLVRYWSVIGLHGSDDAILVKSGFDIRLGVFPIWLWFVPFGINSTRLDQTRPD